MAIIKVNDNLLKGDMGDLVELLQGIFETTNLIGTDFMNVKVSQEKEEVCICFSIKRCFCFQRVIHSRSRAYYLFLTICLIT